MGVILLYSAFLYQQLGGPASLEQHRDLLVAENLLLPTSSLSSSSSLKTQSIAVSDETGLIVDDPSVITADKGELQSTLSSKEQAIPGTTHNNNPHQHEHHQPPNIQEWQWQCTDSCDCLPPVVSNATYMHQSYKTLDRQQWPPGWSFFRQSWLDLHPNWHFVFWLDKHNDLLANCMNYTEVYRDRSSIQQADLARMMYLEKYGGLYTDMDYVALQNHDAFLSQFGDEYILLQGRQLQVVGLEWGFAREAGHPFWSFCLHRVSTKPNMRQGCPIFVTGPKLLQRCLKAFISNTTGERNVQLQQGTSYDGITILPPKWVAPIGAFDFNSSCGSWRNATQQQQQQQQPWGTEFATSQCRQELLRNGTVAMTVYSHSWGQGLKC